MKIILYLITMGLLINSCNNSTPATEIETLVENTPELEASEQTTPTETISQSHTTNVSEADYQELYEDGTLKIEGNFNSQEQRNGLWISYYENGTKWSETLYKDGLKNGHSVTFFPNGKTRYIGEYQNDTKIGRWSFYTEDGELFNEEEY